jgi:hypothetical protein
MVLLTIMFAPCRRKGEWPVFYVGWDGWAVGGKCLQFERLHMQPDNGWVHLTPAELFQGDGERDG